MDIAKEKRAIQYLKSFEPESEPYYGCYSGGKDSDAIRILLGLANVKFDLVHNHTTVDTPETVRYVRSIPNVIIDYPEKSMWDLIIEKMFPPTRLVRYCCERLKERGGQGRVKVTGVRWEESNQRKLNGGLVKIIGKPATTQKIGEELGAVFEKTPKGALVLNTDNDENRRFVESCYRTTSTLINPIIDWTTQDVWDFLNHYGCKSNPGYACGENRIGCIGCPCQNSKGMYRDFAKYPKYRAQYVRTFDRMLEARLQKGLPTDARWKDGESVMRWWLGEDPLQITLDEYMSLEI